VRVLPSADTGEDTTTGPIILAGAGLVTGVSVSAAGQLDHAWALTLL
jgi:hypothetical protein